MENSNVIKFPKKKYYGRFLPCQRGIVSLGPIFDEIMQDEEKYRTTDNGPFVGHPKEWKGNLPVIFTENVPVDKRNKEGRTTLMLASLKGDFPLVKLMVEKGADLEIRNRFGRTAIALSALNGRLDVLQYLMEHGADINSRDHFDETPLTLAVFGGRADVVDFLLENGGTAEIDECMLLAAAKKHFRIVMSLMEKCMDINARYENGNTVLMSAAEYNNYDVAKKAIEMGADLEIVDSDCFTALALASHMRNFEIVKLLVANGADTEGRYYGRNPLFVALSRKYYPSYEVVEFLLQIGANPDAGDRYSTPLSEALESMDTNLAKKLARLLIRWNANVNGKGSEDWKPPIFAALRNGHFDFVEEFVQMGVDLSIGNYKGKTALMYLVEVMPIPDSDREKNKGNIRQYCELASMFIEAGSDVNAEDKNGQSPLLFASYKGNTEIVCFLVEKGADIEHKDSKGDTALILAAKQGHFEIVKILISLGAVMDEADHLGNTAYTYAYRNNHTEIETFLLDNGAKKIIAGKAGIFQDLPDRVIAESFPMFGKGPCFEIGLNHLIKKYGFEKIFIKTAGVHHRDSMHLRKNNINTLSSLLMTSDEYLHKIKGKSYDVSRIRMTVRAFFDGKAF